MALKQGEQNIRKLFKVGRGSSYAVTLPISAIRKFKWQEKQKVVIEADAKRKRLVIKDWKK